MLPTEDKLRHFRDLDDLFDNCSNEKILEWVNLLAASRNRQRQQGKRYRMRNQEFARVAREFLQEDERMRVEEIVEERMEAKKDATS